MYERLALVGPLGYEEVPISMLLAHQSQNNQVGIALEVHLNLIGGFLVDDLELGGVFPGVLKVQVINVVVLMAVLDQFEDRGCIQLQQHPTIRVYGGLRLLLEVFVGEPHLSQVPGDDGTGVVLAELPLDVPGQLDSRVELLLLQGLLNVELYFLRLLVLPLLGQALDKRSSLDHPQRPELPELVQHCGVPEPEQCADVFQTGRRATL